MSCFGLGGFGRAEAAPAERSAISTAAGDVAAGGAAAGPGGAPDGAGGVAVGVGGVAVGVGGAAAGAARTPTDRPARREPPVVGPSRLADGDTLHGFLDGFYVWLGPVGAVAAIDGTWDTAFGADLSMVRVREGSRLGTIGGTAGASIWTERGGGRLWVDGLVGTRLGGRMYGASLGSILELGATAHPRVGASLGLWAFFGVTPFARVGVVQELGAFAEIGLHLSLPVFRRR